MKTCVGPDNFASFSPYNFTSTTGYTVLVNRPEMSYFSFNKNYQKWLDGVYDQFFNLENFSYD